MASRRHNNTKMLFYVWINKAWLTVHVEQGHLGGVSWRTGVGLFVFEGTCYLLRNRNEELLGAYAAPGFYVNSHTVLSSIETVDPKRNIILSLNAQFVVKVTGLFINLINYFFISFNNWV
jgi:hypothetical protein